jgi:excisionase family DNA binding protein
MSDPHGTVLTIGELAEYLKISKSTLYKLAQGGGLPGVKVGRHWRFHRDAVDALLMRNPEHSARTGRRSTPRRRFRHAEEAGSRSVKRPPRRTEKAKPAMVAKPARLWQR